jgi:hypothetical protein
MCYHLVLLLLAPDPLDAFNLFELPRSGKERGPVSLTTHSAARQIEGGSLWVISSFQPPVSSFQNLIATPASRNQPNSSSINEICSSNRNKMRGAAGLPPRRSRRGGRLGISRNASAVARLLREGGSRISNRETSGNRNCCNSLKTNAGHQFESQRIWGGRQLKISLTYRTQSERRKFE